MIIAMALNGKFLVSDTQFSFFLVMEIASLKPIDKPVVQHWLDTYLSHHLSWWNSSFNPESSQLGYPDPHDRQFLIDNAWDKIFAATEQSHNLVQTVRIKNAAVGIIHAAVESDPLFGFQVGKIHWIFIDPLKRRQGFGQILMRTAHDWIRQRNPRGIELMVSEANQPAKRFYDMLGYVVTDQRMLAR